MKPADRTSTQGARLPLLQPDRLTPEQKKLYEDITNGPRGSVATEDGSLVGPFNAMLHSPVVGGALQGLGLVLRFETNLPKRAREMATLAVAAHTQSEYEWGRHEVLGRLAGITEQELSAIRSGGRLDLQDPLEDVVLRVTRALLRTGDLSDQEYAVGITHLGASGLVDLSTLVGYYVLLAMQLRIFRVSFNG